MKYALGLGGNCGDRISFLRKAVRSIKAVARLQSISPIYESKAMLPAGAQADWDRNFLNLALVVETPLAPLDLLLTLKKIETGLGRRDRERWAPREIDIDILAAEQTFSESAGSADPKAAGAPLTIPHAGLRDRPFALLPLADVWPEWRSPWNATAKELARPWAWSSKIPFDTKRTGLSLTELVGIVNVTPDSFSGDGLLERPEHIHAHMSALIEGGATVLDIGAESTRPDGKQLAPEEEWKRLREVFAEIVPFFRGGAAISLDSRHPETVRRALELGVDWINDVSGLRDKTMIELAARSGKKIVAMHSLTVPVKRDVVLSDDKNPLGEILAWGEKTIATLEQAGVPRENIILDPGIGFGKTLRQNIHLLRESAAFHAWGAPVYIGHSRKSYLNELTARPSKERDLETAVVSAELAKLGIEYLRVHDPAMNARAIQARSHLL